MKLKKMLGLAKTVGKPFGAFLKQPPLVIALLVTSIATAVAVPWIKDLISK